MIEITNIISVVSGKGGVGKTTLVSNLGVALTGLGKSVLVIDANVTGANLGLHLGVPSVHPVSLNDVLKENNFLTQAIYKHSSGVSVIPASLHDLEATPHNLKHLLCDVVGKKDFILIDAAAGTDVEVRAAVEASDNVIIVTNSEMPAVMNALSAKKLAETHEKNILGIVLNNVRNEKHELRDKEIENLIGSKIIAKIPEHKKVREAIHLRKPVVVHSPGNPSSREIKKLSYFLTGEDPPKNIFEKFVSFLKGV